MHNEYIKYKDMHKEKRKLIPGEYRKKREMEKASELDTKLLKSCPSSKLKLLPRAAASFQAPD